ncbi:MAG TPA: hypothetical protein VFI15_10200 [Candidatus Limnocylindrales bacterium]|nr:hypothetical protein [Candidatus Limnocylindrales bacterium]
MTDQPRRPPRPNSSQRAVGAPNVLSNQATPNQLSTMGSPSRGTAPGSTPAAPRSHVVSPTTRTLPSRPMPVQAGTAVGRTSQPSDDRFERPRRRPTLGTLIFIGFVIFWAARAFGNIDLGGTTGPTSPPRPTAAVQRTAVPAPTIDSSPGKVVFGESVTNDGCDLEHVADRFTLGIDVWWQAEMIRVVPADATVVYVATRDGQEVDRDTVPPDPDFGSWKVLCGGSPVPGYQPGTYRVEIWNEAETELLSSGVYTKFETRAPGSIVLPTRKPSPSP